MFNKYFQPGKLDCDIVITSSLDFDPSPEQKELLDESFDRKSQIWNEHSYRNSTPIANFVWDVLRDKITFLRKKDIQPLFCFSSEYDDAQECLKIHVKGIQIPEPEMTKCKNQPCPYKNYYGICRNCEDNELVKPDPELLKQYQEYYDNFVREVEKCEGDDIMLEKTHRISGFIPDIDEFDAILSPLKSVEHSDSENFSEDESEDEPHIGEGPTSIAEQPESKLSASYRAAAFLEIIERAKNKIK